MRDAEDIMKDAVRFNEIPEGYNLVEAEAFNAMRQIYLMFNKGEISKEVASKNKQRIYGEYEKEAKEFNLVYEMYSDYAGRAIRDTEMNRIKLRELLKNKNRKIEEFDYVEALKVALEIIECVFPRRNYRYEFRNTGIPKRRILV